MNEHKTQQTNEDFTQDIAADVAYPYSEEHIDGIDEHLNPLDPNSENNPHSLGENEAGTENEEEKKEEGVLNNLGSQLHSAPTRSLFIFIILFAISSFVIYKIFIQSDKKKQEVAKNKEIAATQPVDKAKPLPKDSSKAETDFRQIEEPKLPEIEKVKNKDDALSLSKEDLEVPQAFIDQNTEVPTPPSLPVKAPNLTNDKPIAPVAVPQPTQVIQQPPVVQPTLQQQPQQAQQQQPVGPSAEQIEAQKKAKRNASMMVTNGGGSPTAKNDVGDSNGNVYMKDIGNSKEPKSVVTKMTNTDFLVAQGKVITAVLETAINTDLPGTLRAIVSRDVYAESGRSVLVPKGSRIIGSYDNNITFGQKRVLITWHRIIMPDGLDIIVDSPGVDPLGRSGVRGLVDNKYYELFKNSILLSTISIGGSAILGGSSASSSINTTTTNSGGGSTTSQTGSPTDFAILGSVQDLQSIAKKITQNSLDAQPTITIDQGTLINIFVNRDLVFPADRSLNGPSFVN